MIAIVFIYIFLQKTARHINKYFFYNYQFIIKNFALFISKRYIFSRKKLGIINVLSIISILGIAFSTATMIIVLSIFNGLDAMIKDIYNNFDADIKIEEKNTLVFDKQEVIAKLQKISGIAAISSSIEEQALLTYEDKQIVIVLKGIDSTYKKIIDTDDIIYDGRFKVKEGKKRFALLGISIAERINYNLLNQKALTIYAPKKNKKIILNPANTFLMRKIYPAGIFNIQAEVNDKIVFVALDFAQEILDYDENKVSQIELKLKNNVNTNEIKKNLKQLLGAKFTVKDRNEQHEFIYKMLKTEKIGIIIILAFILIIASFNIVSTLVMMFFDKRNDYKILSSLGAKKKTLKTIITFKTLIISFIGTALGISLALIFYFLQNQYGIISLDANLIIDKYPIELRLSDFIIICIIIFSVSITASLIPRNLINSKSLISK